jgi:glucosamine--fructose-6-phosphate aminotransferase (isomerizing)
MCGIIGYTGHRDAAPLLLEGLRRLEYRGYDSAGVAIADPRGGGGPARVARCEGKIARLAERLAAEPLAGHCGIGHTRWATHGRPSERNAHPHRVGRVSVVHNGIIENHLALRAELEAAGRRFESETDTEIFAHLIDRELAAGAPDGVEAVRRALVGVRGTWALCVIDDHAPAQIVVARRGSPVLIGLDEAGGRETFVMSDVAAVLAHTRAVVDLDDGDVAEIGPGTLRIVDADGAAVERAPRTIDWSPVAAEKQGFKHFMLKEIHEQPQVIGDTLMGRISLEQGDVFLDGVELDPAAISRITLVGCGTSFHAGLVGKYLIEALARRAVSVELASEYRDRDPIVGEGELLIAISQSGETADTLAAMRVAKAAGARTLGLCNVIGSTLAREADQVIYTHAGPEISVASTKAFTTQLTLLTLLALHLGKRTGTLEPARMRELLEGLARLPQLAADQLEQRPVLRTIARRYLQAHDWLYLGRQLGYPVALEGALKLKEISYAHAEAYASGEMKHGPIALIDATMPVVIVALRGRGYDKVLSNLEVVRARGGRIIALASHGDERIGDLADDVILVPDVDELLQPVLASIPLQLLAYHVADLRGTDVDQPRNLAKSVTVE